jgi:hypothetical protein
MIKKIKQRLLSIDLSDDKRDAVERIVQQTINDVVGSLEEMVTQWENLELENDNSFYTLGIRRSIDVVTGENYLDQLPVLENENTPDQ